MKGIIAVLGNVGFTAGGVHIKGLVLADNPWSSTPNWGNIYINNGIWASAAPSVARTSWIGQSISGANPKDGVSLVYWRDVSGWTLILCLLLGGWLAAAPEDRPRPFVMYSNPPHALVFYASDWDRDGRLRPDRRHTVLGITSDLANPIQLQDDAATVRLELTGHKPVTMSVWAHSPPTQVIELPPDNLLVAAQDAIRFSWRLQAVFGLVLLAFAAGAWMVARRYRRVVMVADDGLPTFINRTIDGYTVVDKLGEGAFSQVYKGVRSGSGETVAIKVLRREYLEAGAHEVVTRFNRETMVQLVHPHVVTVFAAGDYLFRPYIILEFIDGDTLRELLTPRLGVSKTIDYFLQMCEGLEFAHRRGYIHRDLKPENIMVHRQGTIKIMDFGIAKHLNRPAATLTATTMGTPRYISPEHLDSNQTDARSDIYSMGVILFEMLTGRTPFEGSLMELIGAHMFTTAPRITDVDDHLPVELADIVARMLEKAPEARYQTMDEVAEGLRAAAHALKLPGF